MPAKNTSPPELPKAGFPKLDLPLHVPFAPMEARQSKEIPQGKQYIYEPKWDGFRCLAFRDNEKIVLQSKAGQPLGRYFPEIVEALEKIEAKKFVLDAEIVVEVSGHLDFDAILQRIHPAESRIKRLSVETPARMLCFDLLVDAEGESLVGLPLAERKERLERFFKKFVPQGLKPGSKSGIRGADKSAPSQDSDKDKNNEKDKNKNKNNSNSNNEGSRFLNKGRSEDESEGIIQHSPFSREIKDGEAWMHDLAAYGCDGVMAKLADEPYHSGDRDGMVKIKRMRTADCVVGGFRYASKKESGVGSLLLGLYNDEGRLDHVGFTSSFSSDEKLKLVKTLKPLVGGEGFTGKAPGGPSRWNASNGRSSEWKALEPKLVCEVQFDHISNERFRHGTKFLRWRPDKSPKQCTFEQLEPAKSKRAA